jgi:hypothetical protein
MIIKILFEDTDLNQYIYEGLIRPRAVVRSLPLLSPVMTWK